MKAPYPGRPKKNIHPDDINPHQNNKREYIRKQLTFSFETEKEVENFENMIKNLKYKTGESRQDKLIMMGFEILRRKVNQEIEIVDIKKKNDGE